MNILVSEMNPVPLDYGMPNVALFDIFYISIGSYFITIVYFGICI